MITRLFDKLIFGFILVMALQLPQLADHYQQFLAGLYTNHIKYLISSESHRHLNPRRIDEEMVIPF
ncbi:DUF2937 family protein [Shewanella decolorationis]|uniref:DUF2937 family protein n=1 Tax=Shewanella decolorationis TaxID=256839 RepID=UPI003C7B04DB